MNSYITVKERSHYEYEDRKSIFIGEAMPVSSEAEALSFIDGVKKRYPDARHHVYAYVLRENSTMRFTDDREPQGTAGMPVLDSIRKRGVTDVVVVVTRYFGGTLLGTGGLVRAYTAAAVGALEAATIIKYDIYAVVSINISYSDYNKISAILEQYDFRTEDTEYLDNVRILGKLTSTSYADFNLALTEITSGRAEIELIEEKFDY